MQNQFDNYIESKLPFLKKGKSVIAISGGIDSVVLAHLCHKLDLDFALAHCNFNLRDEESNEDEDFVLELGEQLDVETFVQNFDTQAYAQEHKLSIQMAARELRYNWFEELAEQLQFNYVLTAHHADDNLETFLINFTRGTGLNGLTGIPEVNGTVIRPLLQFSRLEIEDYARANNIIWREDSSNSSRKYLRNKLRHEVIPILKEINPRLLESFQNTLSHLNDTTDIVTESLKAVSKRAIISKNEKEVTYNVSEFKKVNNSKAYLFEMFKDYGFTEWNDVENLLDAETGKYVISNTHKLTKHREFLILTALHQEKQNNDAIVISDLETNIQLPIGEVNFSKVTLGNTNSVQEIYVDANQLEFPLQIRQWKTGDEFYPFGMKGKKKISKYLKDEKLTPLEKDNVWLLMSGEKVVWVMGKRADERFKINNSTTSILKIKLIEA